MKKGIMKPHVHRYSPFEKKEDWRIEREADSFVSSLLMPKNEFFMMQKCKRFLARVKIQKHVYQSFSSNSSRFQMAVGVHQLSARYARAEKIII